MKIRTGFVSNSSSSSFIISIDNVKNLSQEDLIKYNNKFIMDLFDFNEDTEISEKYLNILNNANDNNRILFYVDIDYNNNNYLNTSVFKYVNAKEEYSFG